MQRNLSEFIGTFGLVVVGPGAIMIGLSHFWVSFAFGVIVFLMILMFGKISGAHINPAVSLAFYFQKGDKALLAYIPFQLCGALAASILLWFIFPDSVTYGETIVSGSVFQAVLIEILISFVLMYSILIVDKLNNVRWTALVVGFVVFLMAYLAGSYTGASMNPARSFGPAIVTGRMGELWLYFVAPSVGAFLAVKTKKILPIL